MSTIVDTKAGRIKFHIEKYDGAMEVVDKCRTRAITSPKFTDVKARGYDGWQGVKSYDEALDYMRSGYQPSVESMRGVFKAKANGETKRFAFRNNVQGFAPVVPLALKNVPNCMLTMQMTPIKAKVVDVYYDMTVACTIDSDDIIKAGQVLLGTVIELERQGYRFNLYACQSYTDSDSCDMLVVKIKDAMHPLDLKRISFPLTHTGFFRVIGFDWYSKLPGGKYRPGYGRALSYEVGKSTSAKIAQQLFGRTAIYISAADIVKSDKEYVKEVLTSERKA